MPARVNEQVYCGTAEVYQIAGIGKSTPLHRTSQLQKYRFRMKMMEGTK